MPLAVHMPTVAHFSSNHSFSASLMISFCSSFSAKLRCTGSALLSSWLCGGGTMLVSRGRLLRGVIQSDRHGVRDGVGARRRIMRGTRRGARGGRVRGAHGCTEGVLMPRCPGHRVGPYPDLR